MKSKLMLGAISLMVVVGACAGCNGGEKDVMPSPSATAPVAATAPASESEKAPATESAKAPEKEGEVPKTTVNLGEDIAPTASASAKAE